MLYPQQWDRIMNIALAGPLGEPLKPLKTDILHEIL